jgi:hypothetical protein
MINFFKILLVFIFIFLSTSSYANTEGYDWYLTTSWVEFDGDCFIEGDNIYMYDWSSSNYHIVDIEDIACYSSGCEIEIYDYTFSSYRYIELEEDLC